MRKYIIPFMIVFLLFAAVNAEAQNKVRAYTALTGGGTGALDKTSATELTNLDMAMVVTATDLYFFSYVASASDAESSPLVIRPNDYGATNLSSTSTGVWKLVSFNALAYRSSGSESYITLNNNTSRSPTAAAYEIYFEGGNTLRININGTEYSAIIGGASDIDAAALNFITTGNIAGKIGIVTKSDNYTLGADAAREAYGYMVFMTGNYTLTLPAVAAGMSVCLYSVDATAKIVDPNGSDGIRNGTAARNADGHSITSGGTAGDFVCLVADSADGWTVLGKSGTWTDE